MTDGIDPMEDLRRQFVAAARKEIRPARARHGWRTRIGVFLGVLLATGAVAEGVNLVSTGEPAKQNPEGRSNYGPAAGGGRIAITSDDPGRDLPWAVVTYRKRGRLCATAGELRGNELGELRDGVFHSFGSHLNGTCDDLVGTPFTVGTLQLDGRTVVFGRARDGIEHMVAEGDGKPVRAKTGADGAFLFVFDGDVGPLGPRVRPER